MITLRQDPNQYRTMLRLLMQDRKGDSAVYVDEEYMQRNGLTNRDVSAIAEMIAYQLVCHTNKAYGHGS
jgi:hypothetical protein